MLYIVLKKNINSKDVIYIMLRRNMNYLKDVSRYNWMIDLKMIGESTNYGIKINLLCKECLPYYHMGCDWATV